MERRLPILAKAACRQQAPYPSKRIREYPKNVGSVSNGFNFKST